MNIEIVREYCLLKKDATECFPFGDDTLGFKVKGRIFALTNIDSDLTLNLKCDPSLAIESRKDTNQSKDYTRGYPDYRTCQVLQSFHPREVYRDRRKL